MAMYTKHLGKLVDDSLSTKGRVFKGLAWGLALTLMLCLVSGLIIFMRVFRTQVS